MYLRIVFLFLLILYGCENSGHYFESDEATKLWFDENRTQMKAVVQIFIDNPELKRVELDSSESILGESSTSAKIDSVKNALKDLDMISVAANYDHSHSPPALVKVNFLIERWGIAVSGGGLAITWFTDHAVGISNRVACNDLIPLSDAGWYIEKLSSESTCQN